MTIEKRRLNFELMLVPLAFSLETIIPETTIHEQQNECSYGKCFQSLVRVVVLFVMIYCAISESFALEIFSPAYVGGALR